MRVDVVGAGFLAGAAPTDLAGISTLALLPTASGPALIAISIGGGVISAFAPGNLTGVAQYVDGWNMRMTGLALPGSRQKPAAPCCYQGWLVTAFLGSPRRIRWTARYSARGVRWLQAALRPPR
jgi:hypothetical protein